MKCFTVSLAQEYPFLGEQGRNPVLTCYLPYNLKEMNLENQLRPAVVLCPGGGYRYVSERESEPIALLLLNSGCNVFVLNYSVAPHTYPCQLIEAAAAFDYISRRACEFNTDISRTGIMGFSAGGHLAAHYSNKYDLPEIRSCFPQSVRPAFTVLGYPVISADPRISHQGSFEKLLGHPLGKDEIDGLSVDKMVTKDTPPAFIWTTATDRLVPAVNSLRYAEALGEQGVSYCLHVYPFGSHGLSRADGLTNRDGKDAADSGAALAHAWIYEFCAWLEEVLKRFGGTEG